MGQKRRIESRGTPAGVEACVECPIGHVDNQGLLAVAKNCAEGVGGIHHVHEKAVTRQAWVRRFTGLNSQRVAGRGVATAILTGVVVHVGTAVKVACGRVGAPPNIGRREGAFSVETVGDPDLVIALAEREHLIVQNARDAAGGGDLHHEPTAVDRQGVGGGVQHIPRCPSQGVHVQCRATRDEVIGNCGFQSGVLDQGRICRAWCCKRCRSGEPDRGVAVVCEIGKRGKKGRVDARCIPTRIERTVEDARGSVDLNVVDVRPIHRGKFVGGVFRIHIKSIHVPPITHGWGGFHGQGVLRGTLNGKRAQQGTKPCIKRSSWHDNNSLQHQYMLPT